MKPYLFEIRHNIEIRNNTIVSLRAVAAPGGGTGGTSPPPETPKNFAKYGKQSTPQPAMKIKSRKIFKFSLNFSNFYKKFLKNFQNFLKNF